MSHPLSSPTRRPLSSLATRIIFVVFLSTFLTAAIVSWISVHSTYTFLRAKIDGSYPALLAHTAVRVDAWLDDGATELASLAPWPTLLDPDTAARALGSAGEQSLYFDALALVDGDGAPLASYGPGFEADSLTARVSIPDTEPPLELRGRYRALSLDSQLRTDGLGASGRIVLVDRQGQPRHAAAGRRQWIGSDQLASGRVFEYRNANEVHMVGAARSLVPGWYLLVQEPFEEAFEPVFAVVTRVFVIDLCIILLFSFLAYKITSTIVRPIQALSKGARRISEGHLDVEFPDPDRQDEIGLLTHTLEDMTRRLLGNRAEIEQANQQLLRQNEALQRANEVLEQLSITDGLTKLHNHRFFQDHLTREIKRVRRTGESLSMLICDIDDFKRLNDRLGHAAGDEMLLGIAQTLQACVRDSDFLARYGGEEFVVLAADTDLAGAVHLGEKIRTAIAEGSFILDRSNQLTRTSISVGVAQYRGNRRRFFHAADQALYAAKAAGKNCVVADEEAEPTPPPKA